ncbi:MAG: tRNA (adenosine(37)-N6)-threonylcarbamoyltransferase complex ATPase subunit type 1 TsaE [Ktedonobacteraceae bacterium]|nr:tRNA (adenosine(37)-N6)-threonylcarbamoyltransferase complex ATPase subunit type 1 TsaE [Ktedonobacteraceae bacterium]
MTRYTQDEATCTLDIISHGPAQTQRLGMRLGELLRGGELILLDGQLGTGKTTFTQGLAKGMHINEVVSSPTFTLLKEYPGGQPPLYHFDLYRLDEPEEILDLGFEDYFYGDGVCIVEWAGKADAVWGPELLRIRMRVINETKRSLLFIATGAPYCELLRQFQKNTYATVSS